SDPASAGGPDTARPQYRARRPTQRRRHAADHESQTGPAPARQPSDNRPTPPTPAASEQCPNRPGSPPQQRSCPARDAAPTPATQHKTPNTPTPHNVKPLIRPGKHRPHINTDLTTIKRPQPTPSLTQLSGQHRQRKPRMQRRPSGHNTQRQRQPRTPSNNLQH